MGPVRAFPPSLRTSSCESVAVQLPSPPTGPRSPCPLQSRDSRLGKRDHTEGGGKGAPVSGGAAAVKVRETTPEPLVTALAGRGEMHCTPAQLVHGSVEVFHWAANQGGVPSALMRATRAAVSG